MRNKLSILISTNRPYNLFAQRVVDRLYQQDMSDNEVILCSTFPIQDPRVKCVRDMLCVNGPLGYNQAANQSSGDIMVVLTDDHFPPSNINETRRLLESFNFGNKKYKVATLSSGGSCYTGDGIPQYLMCRFPVMHRDTFNKLNGIIFHPNFNLRSPHYADCYLSYFLGVNDSECVELPLALQSFQHENREYINDNLREECRHILLNLVSNYKKGEPYLKV